MVWFARYYLLVHFVNGASIWINLWFFHFVCWFNFGFFGIFLCIFLLFWFVQIDFALLFAHNTQFDQQLEVYNQQFHTEATQRTWNRKDWWQLNCYNQILFNLKYLKSWVTKLHVWIERERMIEILFRFEFRVFFWLNYTFRFLLSSFAFLNNNKTKFTSRLCNTIDRY